MTAKLVCLFPARDCASDLAGYFESVRRFADAVVALDDGSTDTTARELASEPLVKVLLSNPVRDSYQGWDDGANRNRLLAAAAELDPDWVLSLDSDERLDEADSMALRDFIERDALPTFAYGFRVVRMVDDLDHFEELDYAELNRDPLWVCRLFAFERGQRFPDDRLHGVPVPTSIPRARWLETTLRIQHLAGSTDARRRRRHEKYRQADPENYFQKDYQLLLEAPANVRPWSPRSSDLPVLSTPTAASEDGDESEAEGDDVPVISAVIISHGDEPYMRRAVRAVVRQQCPEPFEVIVVTSGSARTAQAVRNEFPEVTLVELPRPALPGEARNAGLRRARGEYVTFPGSHVELIEGSLAARLRAHDQGYPMVTGATLNGTHSWAGWASYFLEHSSVLPDRPSGPLTGPPGHCSYSRDLLVMLGGFPEDLRAGEDTAVNRQLVMRGYGAYFAQDVTMIHYGPCTTPIRLLRHHFVRGRAVGRILMDDHRGEPLLSRRFLRDHLLRAAPRRMLETSTNVRRWGGSMIPRYRMSFPLVMAAVASSFVGTWYEILRPAPGKARTLVGALGLAGLDPGAGRSGETDRSGEAANATGPVERVHSGWALAALYPLHQRFPVLHRIPLSIRRLTRRTLTGAAVRGHLARCREVTIIGITGSKGKTTTKDLLATMLSAVGPTVKTPHNDNGLYGVPASLLSIRPTDRFAAIELGILDRPGEMEWMSGLFSPRVAVLTGIWDDHIDVYGSRQAIAREKRALLERLGRDGTAVVNADDPIARSVSAGLDCEVLLAGWAGDAHLRLCAAKLAWPKGLDVEISAWGQMVRARIPLHGEHLAPLVALALGAAAACGVPVERALQATSTFTPPLGRLSPVPGPNGSMFVLDTFKSRLPNAIAALEAFGEMDARRRIAVLGEVQDRDHDVHTYTPIGDLLLGSVDVVLAVGRCAGPLRDLLRGTSLQHHFMTATCVDDAAAQLGPQLREGDLVLMHGADHQGLQHVKWLLDKEAMRLAVSSNGHLQDEDAP